MRYIGFLLFLFSLHTMAQNPHLEAFAPLVNKTWKAEGKWSNGSKFIQEVSFKYDLQKNIVVTNSKGFIDDPQTKFGNRNHGVRMWSNEAGAIKFWEFDVFGGVTEGTVTTENKNFVYTYDYGGTIVTDMWEYIDENTYRFVVGVFKDGKWESIYLDTRFKAVPSKD